MSEHHWISAAIKHHGALRNKAKHAGMSTEAFARKHQHAAGVLGHQARLGLTLMHLHKHDSENGPTEKMNKKADEQEGRQ
jgi:hypothetical protein